MTKKKKKQVFSASQSAEYAAYVNNEQNYFFSS